MPILIKKRPTKKKLAPLTKVGKRLIAGGEPGPFADDFAPTQLEKIHLLNWYNANSEQASYQKWIVDWCQKNGYQKTDVSKLKSAPKHVFNSSWSSIARMSIRGLQLDEYSLTFLKSKIQDVILSVEDEPAKEEIITKKSPQDIIKIKSERLLDSIEDVVDNWELNSEYSLYTELSKEAYSSASAKRIRGYYLPLQAELQELVEHKTPDLVEGYNHMSVQKRKKYLAFINMLIEDADRYISKKSATRNTRVAKPITTEKLVSKVKYKKEDGEYKITSVDPINIIGSSTVFVFNVKYRELRMYVASTEMGLRVKGTTLINFDENKSQRKKLRKPEDAITSLLKSTKLQVSKCFDSIKTRPADVKGRINEDCIILRIIK
jgi:hypothetical protein